MSSDHATTKPPPSDLTMGLLVFGITATIFYPISRFLVEQTIIQDQLSHSFMVLLMAGALLVYQRRLKLRPVWELGRWARGLLVASYGVLGLIFVVKFTLLIIPAFCLAIASFVIFVFGEGVKRFTAALVAAFGLFQTFVLLQPATDWPLRGIAGQFSGTLLHWLGKDIRLGVREGSGEPLLMLLSNGHPFEVATECNGFGVIVSAFLLSLLLVLYRRIPVLYKVGSFLGAGLLGLVFNSLRITVIVLLAPVVGMKNYHLMHEIVGTLFYYGALVAVWVMIEKLPTSFRPAKAPAGEAG